MDTLETRGRKPKYDTPEKLRLGINEYFKDCAEKKLFPDYAGMCLWLKITKATLKKYQDPDQTENAAEYQEVLEEAAARRESYLVRVMVQDNRRAQGCLNALKQKENGGYTDRPQESNEKTLNINLVGVGGWDAFK